MNGDDRARRGVICAERLIDGRNGLKGCVNKGRATAGLIAVAVEAPDVGDGLRHAALVDAARIELKQGELDRFATLLQRFDISVEAAYCFVPDVSHRT